MVNNKKVAIYCRVARKDDGRIELQKEQLVQYAKGCGHNNVVIYADNGASGNGLNRPAFMQMDVDINAGAINLVIVQSITRIGRNVLEVSNWIDGLQRKGVEVKALDGSLNNEVDSLTHDIFKALHNSTTGRKGGRLHGSYKQKK